MLYLKGACTFPCCTFIDLLILLGIIHWVSLEWFTNTCQELLSAYEIVCTLYHFFFVKLVCENCSIKQTFQNVMCYIHCHMITHVFFYYIACLHQQEVSSYHLSKIQLFDIFYLTFCQSFISPEMVKHVLCYAVSYVVCCSCCILHIFTNVVPTVYVQTENLHT